MNEYDPSTTDFRNTVFTVFCSALHKNVPPGSSSSAGEIPPTFRTPASAGPNNGSDHSQSDLFGCSAQPGTSAGTSRRAHLAAAASSRKMEPLRNIPVDDLEIPCIPSAHCAFAIARHLVLKYGDPTDLVQYRLGLPGSGEEEGLVLSPDVAGLKSASSPSPSALSYPALVRMGITCLYDFLKDLNSRDTGLCLKALTPLFAILEGLGPAELLCESKPLLEELFNLLRELSDSACADVSALATSAMLGLSVASGYPDFLLDTACLLICRPITQESTLSQVQIPENFRMLYRAIYQIGGTHASAGGNSAHIGASAGKAPHRPTTVSLGPGGTNTSMGFRTTANWLNTCIRDQHSFSLESGFRQNTGTRGVVVLSLACDGPFLYVISNRGIFKIGTGCADTVKGSVYAFNDRLFADDLIMIGDSFWTAVLGNNLFVRRRASGKLTVIESETLQVTGEVLLQTVVTDGILCSLPNRLSLLKVDADNNLVLFKLDSNFLLSQNPELSIKLIQTKFIASGEHACLEAQQLVTTLKPNMEEKIREMKIGKDIALFLTEQGKVYFIGRGSLLGMNDSMSAWTELHLPDVISKICLGHSGNHAVLLTSNGQALFAGTATRGEDGEKQGLRRQTLSTKSKRYNIPKGRKVVWTACNSGTTALVTDDGNVYMFGKDIKCCNSAGLVQGLDSPVVQISLGRAHAVGLTKYGHVYSFGMNTFGQCGRTDTSYGSLPRGDTSDSDRSSKTDDDMPSDKSITPTSICQPAAHVWVAGSGGWCSRCGKCAIHGNACPRASPRRIVRALKHHSDKSLELCSAADGNAETVAAEGPCMRCGVCRACVNEMSPRHSSDARSGRDSDSDGKVPDLTVYPGRIIIKGQFNPKISQVSCGHYHTILLSAEGHVITFGGNRFGQLGVGDFRTHLGPQVVPKPANAAQIAAGAYHSVVRTKDGLVYTFGKNNARQLDRDAVDDLSYASPELMDSFELCSDRKAVWIGASADLTLVKYEQSLLSTDGIQHAIATGNSRYLLIFPRNQTSDVGLKRDFTYLAVDRNTGLSKHFKHEAFNSSEIAVCMDHRYDVIWYYSANNLHINCFSPDLAGLYSSSVCFSTLNFADPEFWLPAEFRQNCSTQHLGLSILTMYRLLLWYRTFQHRVEWAASLSSPTSPIDEYLIGDRFQNFGGGWGYSAQSVEAIQFMCEQAVFVVGFGLLGGRGEYTAKLRLLRILGNADGDLGEQNIELMSESEEILYQCAAREKYHAFLKKPVLCYSEEWYVVCVSINGPSSDCGSGGIPVIITGDGKTFHFRNSRLSNNGTDVHAGQIAQILYRNFGSDSELLSHQRSDVICASMTIHPELIERRLVQLSARFQNSVTARCLSSLLQIVSHCLQNTMQLSLHPDLVQISERLVTVNVISVQLLQHFLLSLYPGSASFGKNMEQQDVVELIEEVFQMLVNIFSCASTATLTPRRTDLLNECIKIVTSAFHVLFPTSEVTRWQLMALLSQREHNDWLLCALLKGLSQQSKPVTFLVSASRLMSGSGSGGRQDYPLLKSFVLKSRKPSFPRESSASSSFDFQSILSVVLRFVFDIDATDPESDLLKTKLQRNAADFALKSITDLVQFAAPPDNSTAASILLQSPSRFSRTSVTMSWDTSSGTPDAISFQVDTKYVFIHGVGVYVGVGSAYAYTLELLVNCGDQTVEEWQLLEKATGNLCAGPDGEVAFIKLNKPVKLIPFAHYAFRLQLQGNRTWSGESGMPVVIGYKGIKFTFSMCSMSINGTNVARGQIPILLYSIETDHGSKPIGAEKAANLILASLKQVSLNIQKFCSSGILKDMVRTSSKTGILFNFLQYFCGLVALFLERCPGYCLDCLRILDDLLPILTSVQGLSGRKKSSDLSRRKTSGQTQPFFPASQNFIQTVAESAHPYQPSTINSTFVNFDESVNYMILEFDQHCSTAQPEDVLHIYVITPDELMIPVSKYSGSSNAWPNRSLFLPSNAVWFVLETATNPIKDTPPCLSYGYKCTITCITECRESLAEILECELSFLSAYCCGLLMQGKDRQTLSASPSVDMSSLENDAEELLGDHGPLLQKGLRLSHQPSVYELKKNGKLPLPIPSATSSFLVEFTQASPLTTAGKLAQWLMPEPYLDLSMCELLVECDSNVQSGQPVVISVITKDQYGRIALVPSLLVQLSLSSISDNRPGPEGDGGGDGGGGQPVQSQHTSFQPTYLNRARYCSITMMQAYQNYSFEEMRLAHFFENAQRAVLSVVSNNDGCYIARWVPKKTGNYLIECRIDGFLLDRKQTVEVSDGRIISRTNHGRTGRLGPNIKIATARTGMSQGVRIRSSPSLFAEQIGLVTRGSAIYYVEEVENNDGTWLRLSDDSALTYCPGIANPTNAWCLHYHIALNRELFVCESTYSERDSNHLPVRMDSEDLAATHSIVVACEERYFVSRCDQLTAGVMLRESPRLVAKIVGSLSLDDEIATVGWLQNPEGIWVQLSRQSLERYAYDKSTGPSATAFCLVQEANEGSVYLDRILTPDASFSLSQRFNSRHGLSPFVFGLSSNKRTIHHSGSNSAFSSTSAAGAVGPSCVQPSTSGAVVSSVEAVCSDSVTSPSKLVANIQNTLNANHEPGPSTSYSSSRPSVRRIGKPFARVSPHPRDRINSNNVHIIHALSPSVAVATRYAFAALLWHSGTVHDAMACATYLKFHDELQSMQVRNNLRMSDIYEESTDDMQELPEFSVPLSFRLLLSLWKEIYEAVITVVSQHLILPSPPMALKAASLEASGTAGSSGGATNSSSECFCELCEGWFPTPVTAHMKLAHPGCGVHAGGQGYNSLGRYSSGWAGNCGEGGHGTAVWYLLCVNCRQMYMKTTGTYKERQKKHRGRFFRSSAALEPPQAIIRNNASFLLELNASCGGSSADWQVTSNLCRTDWSINMFPQVITSPPKISSRSSSISGQHSNESLLSVPAHVRENPAQCSSDPGPKGANADHQLPPAGLSESSWPIFQQNQTASLVTLASTCLTSTPSPALRAIVPSSINRSGVVSLNVTLKRPVMSFIIKHHDLAWIRAAMENSIIRSATLSHCFQVLSWVIRLLNSNQAIHGVIWQFVTSLRLKSSDQEVLRHPLSLVPFAGPWGYPVLFHFHNFLLTVASLLTTNRQLSLEEQRLCLQAWTVHFSDCDHGLILRCRILHTVNRILSSTVPVVPQSGPSTSRFVDDPSDRINVEAAEDVTSCIKLEVSSRKAMTHCLLDRTTETFWESGEEDRVRSKWLYATFPVETVQPILFGIYIDNNKDSGNRVYHVVFHTMANKLRKKLKVQSLSARFTGWVKCIVGTLGNIQVELKSQDHFVRVRQVCLSGHWKRSPSGAPGGPQARLLRKSSSSLQHFNSIQTDAFRVFKLIAVHAFGDSLDPNSGGTVLRNMVFDMAFNCRDQSTYSLHGYVIRQIVSALEKEIALLRDDIKSNYSYCSGLMTMLEKVPNSPSGTQCIRGRQNVIISLSALLVFAPSSIQVAAIQLIRQLLPIFEPFSLDNQRFLNDVLAPIAKALTIQVKEVSRRQSVTTVTLAGTGVSASSWHLEKSCSVAVATHLVALCRDIGNQKYGERWGEVFRSVIGTYILSLALQDAEYRYPSSLLSRKAFWLAMASLTSLEDESWLHESPLWASVCEESGGAGRDIVPVPLCDNHDDGLTLANIWCAECRMNLCRDCNAVFHLNRRSRQHQLKSIGGRTEDSVTVNVRESCGRLKFSWLLVLTDSRTMNGIVEFRDDITAYPGASGLAPGRYRQELCRFCGRQADSALLTVCDNPECQDFNAQACGKLLACGHMCGGIANESSCLPCLRCSSTAATFGRDADDMCMICYTDTLARAPCIQLACGHVFHYHCVRSYISRRWPGPRISFGFIHCPYCKVQINHPAVCDLLEPFLTLHADVSRKCLMRLEYDGLTNAHQLTDPNSPFFQDPAAFAFERYAYYVCYKCNKAYYGGEAQCAAAIAVNENYDPTELLCGACSDVSQAQICPKHGTDFLEYKCRYCCSIAVFFCFGTTHFCGVCHDDFQRLSQLPRHVLPQCPVGPKSVALTDQSDCPLQVKHPPTGEEFALGCGICRNVQTF